MEKLDYGQLVEPLKYVQVVPDYLRDVLTDKDKSKLLDKKRIVIEVPSRLAAATFMKERKDDFYDSDCSRSSREKGNWSGTKTYEEYQEILEGKIPEKDFKKFTEKITERLHTKETNIYRDYIYDTEGYFFDVAKVVEGEPEAYLRPQNKIEEQYATVLINITVNGGVSSEKLAERASYVLEAIKILESNLIKTKIVLIESASNLEPATKDGTTKLTHLAILKEYNQPFDWIKLYAMIHASFLRRFIFKVQEVIGHTHFGYGRVEELFESEIRLENENLTVKKIIKHIVKHNKKLKYDTIKTSN